MKRYSTDNRMQTFLDFGVSTMPLFLTPCSESVDRITLELHQKSFENKMDYLVYIDNIHYHVPFLKYFCIHGLSKLDFYCGTCGPFPDCHD